MLHFLTLESPPQLNDETGVRCAPRLSWTSLQQFIIKYHNHVPCPFHMSVSKALWPGLKLWWTRAWAATQTNNNPRKCKTRKLPLLNFRTGPLSVLTVWPSSCFVPLSKTQSRRGGTVWQNMSAKNFILCFYVFVISREVTVIYSEQSDGNEGDEYYQKSYIHLINCQRT